MARPRWRRRGPGATPEAGDAAVRPETRRLRQSECGHRPPGAAPAGQHLCSGLRCPAAPCGQPGQPARSCGGRFRDGKAGLGSGLSANSSDLSADWRGGNERWWGEGCPGQLPALSRRGPGGTDAPGAVGTPNAPSWLLSTPPPHGEPRLVPGRAGEIRRKPGTPGGGGEEEGAREGGPDPGRESPRPHLGRPQHRHEPGGPRARAHESRETPTGHVLRGDSPGTTRTDGRGDGAAPHRRPVNRHRGRTGAAKRPWADAGAAL